MPEALPPVLSRGHPTLYVFLNAGWMKLFGETILVGRMFILLLSVASVASLFYIVKFWINAKAAFFATLFMILNPIFIAQAGFMLPELPLALAILWSVHFAATNNYVGYIIACSCALLIKETGLIMPFSAVLGHFIMDSRNRQFNIKNYLLDLSPILVFVLFLVVQKMQHGWYLFPYHVSLVQLDFFSILEKLARSMAFTFLVQGRYALSLGLAGILVWIIKKNPMLKEFITPINIISATTLLGMFAFTAINFYMSRYLMLVFPLVGILFASVIQQWDWKFNWSMALALTAVQLFYLYDPVKFNYDADIGYTHSLTTLKKSINDLEKTCKNEDLILADFPANVALEDKRFGYMQQFKKLKVTQKAEENWVYGIKSTPSSLGVKFNQLRHSEGKTHISRYATSTMCSKETED